MAANGQNWWTQPLPGGWEAKFDPNQRRYFFINHETKATTWEDPRQTVWKKQQQQPSQQPYQQQHQAGIPMGQQGLPYQPSAAAAGASHPYQQHHASAGAAGSSRPTPSPRSSPRPSPGRTSPRPEWQQNVEDKFGLRVSMFGDDSGEFEGLEGSAAETKSHGSPHIAVNHQRELTVEKLKQDFPGIDETLLQDILSGVNFSEFRARQELTQLGYRSLNQSGSTSHSPRIHQPTPTPRSVSPSPAPAPAPAPRELTMHEKTQLKDKLSREFPDAASSSVDMALDVCQYNETKARNLLKALNKPIERPKSPTRTSDSRTALDMLEARSRSGTPRTDSAAASRSSTPARTTSGTGTSTAISQPLPTSQNRGVSPARPVPSPRRGSSPHSAATTRTTNGTHRPTARTRATGSPARTTTTSRTAASTPNYVSSNRSKPAGPNKELSKGPDSSLLIEDYIDSKGPDPSLRKGRDMSLKLGPKLRPKGPDAANRAGAGHVHIHGPNPLFMYGTNGFKERKEEENRAKKDASNIGVNSGDMQHCHIEVVDEAVWNDRQGGVCNTLMQALCTRPGRIKETAM